MGEKLTIGIALTTEPDRSRVLLEDFCKSLSGATGLSVAAHGVWPYHHLLQALESGDVDVVWLPPLLALRATAERACLPLALPVRYGVSTYSTALFTRKGSSIDDVLQLSKAKVAWVDKQSAAGYLVIRAWLRHRAVDLDQAFGEELFLGSHRAVSQAVHSGEADVGATFAYFESKDDDDAVTHAGWGPELDGHISVLGRVDDIPSDLFATRVGLAEGWRRAVQQALVSSPDEQLMRTSKALMGATEFIAPEPEHLQALVELLAQLDAPPRASHTSIPPYDAG